MRPPTNAVLAMAAMTGIAVALVLLCETLANYLR
jgi:hypothetical protein